jgi:ribosome-associated protein
VNKTETRVELRWIPAKSECLDEKYKYLILDRLRNKLTEEGVLILSCERHRSQHRNREEVTERFLTIVMNSMVIPKKRLPTKPSRSSIEKRIKNKKIRGELKRSRRARPEE